MGEKKWLDATEEKTMSMKGSNPPPPDISRKPAPPPSPDRRVVRDRTIRIEKLRDAYQRVQARDADQEAALRDVQDAVLVLLEEFTHTIYGGKSGGGMS